MLHTNSLSNGIVLYIRNVLAGLICLGVLFYSTHINAQGVEAGTNISNIATVSYSIENIAQNPIKSSPSGNSVAGDSYGQATEFVVDRKVDLLVTGNTNANVSPGDNQAEVTFTLQNQGNAIQEFNLSTDSLLASDDFDTSGCNTEISSITGTPLAGVVIPSTGTIKLSPDQQATISVRCNVPVSNGGSAILSGQTALSELSAIAEKNDDGTDTSETNSADTPESIETVFVDGAGSNDLERDATHSATRTYIAANSSAAPELDLNKTIHSVVDPNGGNNAITGSEVTYKIQINTTGIGTINDLVVTDQTPAEMTYKTNSIQLNSLNQSDISDALDNSDFGITTADTATINLGDFAAGSQFEILVTYIIN